MRLSAIWLLLAAGAQAQQPEAATLLQQAGSAMKSHKSYQYSTEMTIQMDIGGKPMKMTISATTSGINPDKVRMESKTSMGGGGATVVSDGEFTWIYIPQLKQYSKKAALGSPQGFIQSFGFDKMPDAAKLAEATRVLRAETVEVDGQRHDCWVLETRVDKLPLPMPPGAELSNVVMTRWLDKELGMDVRSEMSGKMEAGPMKATMQQEMRVHSIQFDQPLPDSLFAFTPPEGAQQVEEISGFGSKKDDLTGKAAPDFQLISLDNGKLDFAALKGKPILLDFWTTWCAPCRRDMPALEKIAKQYPGLVVIGVNGGEERETVERFLKAEPVSYPIAMGDRSYILPAYQVSAFPTYVAIGTDGNIAGYQVGSRGDHALHELVSKLGLKPASDAKQ
jgi:outer membrane lipoprotein-sorting protein/peroxiredoxin